MATRAQGRSRVEDHHAEWLSLVETSGPFLTVPALKRALPDGLEAVPSIMPDLRVAYAEWRDAPELQQRWIRWVLDELLGLRDATTDATEADPSHWVAEHSVTLRPSYVVRDHTREGAPAVLLIHRVEAGVRLDRPVPGEAWSASPIDRAADLARASGVPLALVTDGSRWTLVWARPGESTGICTWRAELWLEEPVTLRAFVSLLGSKRFFNLPVELGLAALLQESAGKQQEVADQLGSQVRRAVELLISTLDREDRDRHGELLADLESAEVYRGAVTVMMRLVFLFVAEERRLLPLDDPRYEETLAASTLRARLQERADRDGEDPLERSTAAWHRILALFRAVHGGIEHDALRLPAYGGGLFDPDRYPFLEGRTPGTNWHQQAAHPLPVDDRTMLHLLDALQTLEHGGARVLLSYQALDVEQIGHVYEGLLDHTAVRLTDTALAFGGKLEPGLALGEIEQWAANGEDTLVEQLAKHTGRSASAVRKSLDAKLADEQRARLRAACAGDDALLDRVAPYHALLREDLRGDPLIILPGSLFVTQALDRRSSGTYYTPRQLAEEVVRHALDPVAYNPGPAQETDPAKWKLRPAGELLDLKIADIAMGSGAFLVAACRYLAARLLEAWTAEGPSAETTLVAASSLSTPLPADPLERDAIAHRLVAERCLYGVDKSPMAVEMAKLSLWLITLAKDRPFSFVDHALRTGDSLIGITDLRQLGVAHIDPGRHRQGTLDLGFGEIEAAIDRALTLRQDLEGFVVRDIPDAERKATLLVEADAALEDARLLGDLVVGAALAQLNDADPLAAGDVAGRLRTMVDHEAPKHARIVARTQLRAIADDWLVEHRRSVGEVREVVWDDRDPFHWALEFSEVRERGGFDAVIGNPPFRGGVDLARILGVDYERYLKARVPQARGFVDLAVYFHRRSAGLINPMGVVALLGPQSLAAPVNRPPGIQTLLEQGMRVIWARDRIAWPGSASIEVCALAYSSSAWATPPVLNGKEVGTITSSLESGSDLGGAHRLTPWLQYSEGTKLYGASFVKSAEEWHSIAGPGCPIDSYLRLYVNAETLCDTPDQQNGLFVPDFGSRDSSELIAVASVVDYLKIHVTHERVKQTRQIHEHRPWLFWDKRERAYEAARELREVIACPNLSKFLPMALVPSDRVFSHGVKFLVSDDLAIYGLLQSSVFLVWAVATSPNRETRVAFSTRASLDTFVPPDPISSLRDVGGVLWTGRREQMLRDGIGLTAVLNRLHDPSDDSEGALRLRHEQQAVDVAVALAYGWTDLNAAHGFHETKFGIRFTFAASAQQEIRDRLLELNRTHHALEVAKGIAGRRNAKGRSRRPAGSMTLEFDGV